MDCKASRALGGRMLEHIRLSWHIRYFYHDSQSKMPQLPAEDTVKHCDSWRRHCENGIPAPRLVAEQRTFRAWASRSGVRASKGRTPYEEAQG